MRRNRENFPIINYPARRRKIGWCKRIAGSRNLTKVWPANYFWPRPKACGLLGKLGKYLSIGGPTGYLPGKPNNLFPRFHLSFFLSSLHSLPFLSSFIFLLLSKRARASRCRYLEDRTSNEEAERVSQRTIISHRGA